MGIDEIIKSVLHRSYHGGDGQMKLVYQNINKHIYALTGVCPHCSVISLCNPVIQPYLFGNIQKGSGGTCAITQCQNCKKFVLLITRSTHHTHHVLDEYYPLGDADDSVADAVPEKIANDFSEALRCFHVKSYKATVTMCRRSIQASAKDLNASGKWLIEQIDDLADKGKITEPLKEMAHQIRKIGNDGAHPDDDLLKDVTEQDASETIEFVREYFSHVYVMPEKLKAMKERKIEGS